jgi:hypothetical protein
VGVEVVVLQPVLLSYARETVAGCGQRLTRRGRDLYGPRGYITPARAPAVRRWPSRRRARRPRPSLHFDTGAIGRFQSQLSPQALAIRNSASTGTYPSPVLFKTASIPSTIALSSQTFAASACSTSHSATISSWQTSIGTALGHSSLRSHRSASASFKPSVPVPWTAGLLRRTVSLSTTEPTVLFSFCR